MNINEKTIREIVMKGRKQERQRICEELEKMKYTIYPSEEVIDWEDKRKCLDYYNKALDDAIAMIKEMK